MSYHVRCGAGDPIHEALRAAICVPIKRYLWTKADEIEFVPALSDTIYGDGRALLMLTTINQRPAYYVVRIDSAWELCGDHNAPDDAPNVADFIDDICQSLEDEFGRARADEEEDDEEILEYGAPWPAFDDEIGCSWGRMRWPVISGVALAPHPFTRMATVLASSAKDVTRAYIDDIGRWSDDGGPERIPCWDRDNGDAR